MVKDAEQGIVSMQFLKEARSQEHVFLASKVACWMQISKESTVEQDFAM